MTLKFILQSRFFLKTEWLDNPNVGMLFYPNRSGKDFT